MKLLLNRFCQEMNPGKPAFVCFEVENKLRKMKLHILETGNFMLDGGAIFGVVPKTLWSKQYPSDANNLCNMALRSLLIETGDRRIIVDTGLGSKQDARFFGYYFLNGTSTLDNSLELAGFSPGDITDVIHTHLHFDHCGGSILKQSADNFSLHFPKARHFVSRQQWEWTLHPNAREKASFLKENIFPLQDSGKLEFAEEGFFCDGIELRQYQGHTAGLMVPFISFAGNCFVFVTDLLPFMAHLPLSWICGYDTRPLLSMEEKEKFLKAAVSEGYTLLFQHDFYHQACTLIQTEKGIKVKEEFSFRQIGIQHHGADISS
jgi:glyoxylase-like metal-dependent hydrolase (beta-lactamase superfamily II)